MLKLPNEEGMILVVTLIILQIVMVMSLYLVSASSDEVKLSQEFELLYLDHKTGEC